MTPAGTVKFRPRAQCACRSSDSEGSFARRDRRGDVVRRCAADTKPGFERGRREVDAGIEHRVEEAVEALLVAGHHRSITSPGRCGAKYRPNMPPTACAAERHAGTLRRRRDAIGECARGRGQRLVEPGRLGSRAWRVPPRRRPDCRTACPPGTPGPSGAIFSMIARLPPNAPTGMPPPITLPSVVRSGVMPIQPLRRPADAREIPSSLRRRSARRRSRRTARAGLREIPACGMIRFMLPAIGSTMIAAIASPARLERAPRPRRDRCTARRWFRRRSPAARRPMTAGRT